MTSQTRLANKTIWALEDIIAAELKSRRTWLKARAHAKERKDLVMLAILGDLRHQLAIIGSKATDARQGVYREEGPDDGP